MEGVKLSAIRADKSAQTLGRDEFFGTDQTEKSPGLLAKGYNTVDAPSAVVPEFGPASAKATVTLLDGDLLVANGRSHVRIMEAPMAMAL